MGEAYIYIKLACLKLILETKSSLIISMASYILVTGGAGYIGIHSVIELVNKGYNLVIVDNLCNASSESIKRAESITGKEIPFHNIDLLDKSALAKIFSAYKISSVIHFAGLKAVGESCQIPLKYYRVNIVGTLNLLDCMQDAGVHKIVFSSSATVYGEPQYLPLDEKHPVGIGMTNPYGKTKYFIEEILRDFFKANDKFCGVLLRYFNPVGAHESGLIGEDPQGPPNNLMPYVAQVAIGRRPFVSVLGMIITPQMAQESEITSMWLILPMDMWLLLRSWRPLTN